LKGFTFNASTRQTPTGFERFYASMQSEISYDTPVGKGAIPLMILESVFRSLLLNPGIKTLWDIIQ